MSKTFLAFTFALLTPMVLAQVPPSSAEIASYEGLLAAAASDDVAQIEKLLASHEDVETRDGYQRTPLLVASHLSHRDAVTTLLESGADANAMDVQRYDLITIAAVNNDVEIIKIGLKHGASPGNITSPYEGTALIAAAHLGHVETVKTLIWAGAPLNHVNNLGWTALIEAIVLGNGGKRHSEIVKLLIEAGADLNVTDRQGDSPLTLARDRNYEEMTRILNDAGAK